MIQPTLPPPHAPLLVHVDGNAGKRLPRRHAVLARCLFAVWAGVGAVHAQPGLAAPPEALAEDVRTGFRIINDVGGGNCVSCHALPGQSGLLSSFGPSLAGIGSRMNAGELRQWIVDARRIKPDTLMPPFGTLDGLNRTNPSRPILNERQIEQVLAALQTLR